MGRPLDGVPAMHAVTSLMRVQQLVIGRLDAILRPHGLTFARYEALVLLVFSSRGSLPLGKMGERLQVHPTSVTSIVRRLEAAGLVVRRPHPEDGRAVLAEITAPAGPWSRPPPRTWSATDFALGRPRRGRPAARCRRCWPRCGAAPATSERSPTGGVRWPNLVGRPTIVRMAPTEPNTDARARWQSRYEKSRVREVDFTTLAIREF